MNHSMNGLGKQVKTVDQPLRRMASSKHLPPRVRAALEGLLSLSSQELERSLAATLADFEEQLFNLADKARNNEIQHRCFESLREIKRQKDDIASRFMLHLENALARIDDTAPIAQNPLSSQNGDSKLALVETTELEESLILQEISARVNTRENQKLNALGYRFGVLAGTPAFDAETLPIGPLRLSEALRYAITNLEIPVDHRVLLFRTFERLVLAKTGNFFQNANNYLIKQRILRHLRVGNPQQVKQEVEAQVSPEAKSSANAAASIETRERAPESGKTEGGVHSAAPQTAPTYGAEPGAVQQSSGSLENDQALFATLRELLSGTQHILRGDAADNTNTPVGGVANRNELQSALGTLQRTPAMTTLQDGKPVPRTIRHVKQDLLNQLRQQSPDGRAPRLEGEASDTIDLVGMLFDYLSRSARPNGCAQTLLTKLQVPLLRVALTDKNFFTRPEHPARKLLNSIAETSMYWVDDGEDADSSLVEKMQTLVDRITSEYNGELNLFEELFTDLSQHTKTLTRKAEVAERRHVDAARGREKLDLARIQASATIAEYLNASKPTKLVRTLLEQTWTDVLALTLLRQGENSDVYKRRLEVANQLLAATADNGTGNQPVNPIVREEFETGLSQIGYHEDDIQAVVKKLFLPEQAANEDNPSSQTELAIKLKSKTRLGTSSDSEEEQSSDTAPHKRMKPRLNATEQAMCDRIKLLPFGTWFEFVTNQQGDTVRRKLCWFSTMTGRCLFVNQRGSRADERTLEQLAIEMVRGQSKIVPAEQESLIDRAWAAIVGSLKQITGRKQEVRAAIG